ncbi:DUF4383 domain-containing protein [Actinophytocola algeriensis]|jgi:hypothetical protein|uniref:Uncharacterized protein n=1 Tax=Actinophytocola algeriensis TaxID=1768010 RepID=A0A7W7QCA4_9PSEU|nr:DUF4383 domain-containing protein [Actinophytocola algeriensis]MBB4911001.1 hypothetical protein [Actinophytocola algeriensis]MBE1473994.1 hypothetical protein [Actinophytocola algeriensis]
MREYERTRHEPGQVATFVVAALFVLAAVLDVGAGVLDNVVHLGFGIAGFALSRHGRGAQAFLIGGGVVYFLLWQFGSVVDPTLVPFHTANVGLHLSLVATMIGIAVLSGGGRDAVAASAPPEVVYLREQDYNRRPVRNRPPGRADQRCPRLTAAGRVPAGMLCRV